MAKNDKIVPWKGWAWFGTACARLRTVMNTITCCRRHCMHTHRGNLEQDGKSDYRHWKILRSIKVPRRESCTDSSVAATSVTHHDKPADLMAISLIREAKTSYHGQLDESHGM